MSEIPKNECDTHMISTHSLSYIQDATHDDIEEMRCETEQAITSTTSDSPCTSHVPPAVDEALAMHGSPRSSETSVPFGDSLITEIMSEIPKTESTSCDTHMIFTHSLSYIQDATHDDIEEMRCETEQATTSTTSNSPGTSHVPPAVDEALAMHWSPRSSETSVPFGDSLISQISNYRNGVMENESRKFLLQNTSQKLDLIKRIHTLALSDKCRNDFTETQRENIKMSLDEMDSSETVDVKEECNEDETAKVSDSNEIEREDIELPEEHFRKEIQSLHLEDVTLKCQFVELQHQMSEMRNFFKDEMKNLKNELNYLKQDLRRRISEREVDVDTARNSNRSADNSDSSVGSTSSPRADREACIIGLLSKYLGLYPSGVCLDPICSFIKHIVCDVNPTEIEDLMLNFPTLFREEINYDDTFFERKWYFIGFGNQ